MLDICSQITVPIFLGNGERDLSPPLAFREEPMAYEAAHDISLYQLAGSAHCQHLATNRQILWQRLAGWCQIQAV